MATRRRFPTPPGPKVQTRIYAAFMAALLDGTIRAERLIETRGVFRLDYDEPDLARAPDTRRSG